MRSPSGGSVPVRYWSKYVSNVCESAIDGQVNNELTPADTGPYHPATKKSDRLEDKQDKGNGQIAILTQVILNKVQRLH